MDRTKFNVTRQHQWPEGDLVVEISQGGEDYTNPGALSTSRKYGPLGEGDEFDGMTDAVEAGIRVAQAWQADNPDKTILIGWGCTHGMTMPFEGKPLTDETFAELREKAKTFDESLPRCGCGSILPKKTYGNSYTVRDNEYPFCSESCAERDEEFQRDEEAQLNHELDDDDDLSDDLGEGWSDIVED